MPLTDMTLDAKEAKDAASCEYDPPKYPYGLQITLDSETLEKLKLGVMPAVGTTLQITALAKVTGVRSYEIQAEKEAGEKTETSESSVDLQITALELGAAANSGAADTLYPSK